MRKVIFMALIVMLFSCVQAMAKSNVIFTWDANIEPDLAGYNLYQSKKSGEYDPNKIVGDIPAGKETYQIIGLEDGEYYWVITAYDQAGLESDYSNEVTQKLETPPAPVKGFQVTTTVTIEISVTQ